MDKIKKESKDVTEEYRDWLKWKFPSCVTENNLDFEKLKELVFGIVDDKEESYFFSWAGRSESLKNIQIPSRSTLIPDQNESIDFDNTENMFIDGDNLEVLKLLQKSYSGCIDMIYIDPPYNTGNDFIYKDDFKNSMKSYLEQTGQSKDGIVLTTNPETSGRFHSDWISFMYPRLFLARNLLKDDGVIFISIGQQEFANLIMICNEIFGEENKIGVISRLMKSGSNKGDFFSPNIDYVLVYANNIELTTNFRLPLEEEYIDRIYASVETNGPLKGERYREMGLYQSSLDPLRGCSNQRYWIQCPDGSFVIPPGNIFPNKITDGEKIKPMSRDDQVWRWSQKKYLLEKKDLIFKETKTSPLLNEKNEPSKWNVYTRIWLKSRIEKGRVPTDLITKCENRHSAAELKDLQIPFDYAKPSTLISYLSSFIDGKNFIVLDFFAGSGTTAHSMLDLNSEDGGNRKFILVQIPEKCKPTSLAKENGYETIAEIAKERIKRVIKKITEKNKQHKLENNTNLDLGFKVFKLAKSNFKIWQNVQDKEKLREQLRLFENPLIENYKHMDVIYEIIIKEGYSLNSKIEEMKSGSNKVYKILDNNSIFYICLDKQISKENIENLNLDKNTVFSCLDSSLDDTLKTNLDLTCKLKVI